MAEYALKFKRLVPSRPLYECGLCRAIASDLEGHARWHQLQENMLEEMAEHVHDLEPQQTTRYEFKAVIE